MSADPHASKTFGGVFPCDHLPTDVKKVPASFIVNTDPSWKPGTHWLAIYIDENRNVEFFDSYGRPAQMYTSVFKFIKHMAPGFRANSRQLQGTLSSTCGQFCLYFLVWRNRGVSFSEIMNSFSMRLDSNDILVTTFVNSISDLNTKLLDTDYVMNQCCNAYVPEPSNKW